MNYSTIDALKELNISESTLSEENKNDLLEKGYCLIFRNTNEWKSMGIDLDLISNVIDKLIERKALEDIKRIVNPDAYDYREHSSDSITRTSGVDIDDDDHHLGPMSDQEDFEY